MRFEDILICVGKVVEVAPELWATAYNLGMCRTLCNERNWTERDRKNYGANRQNDMAGAAIELTLIDAISQLDGSAESIGVTTSRLFVRSENRQTNDQADFLFHDESNDVRYSIEAKGQDCASYKRDVRINVRGWERNAPGPVYYVYGFAPPYARQIALSAPVTYEEVLTWDAIPGDRRPCYRMPIHEFCQQHMWDGFDYKRFLSGSHWDFALVDKLRPEAQFYEAAERYRHRDKLLRAAGGGESVRR